MMGLDFMRIFQYSHLEIDYLKKQDKKLGKVIDDIGFLERKTIPDLFVALINSIVSQQISSKAAATVWARLLEHFVEITPDIFVQVPLEEICKCGLSRRKATYIKEASKAVKEGKLQIDQLGELPDNEVIKKLTSLKGVGIWTAEMLLIFALQRPDVVSYSDLAIRKAMMKLYGLESLSKEEFELFRRRYSPYGSVASLYLWAFASDG